MALLDYLFPLQSSDTITGLLGEDEARKIRQQSQTAGLLNLGANLLALSGPSSQQRSFGQMLAPSLLAGYQAAQGTTESQLQQRLAAQKMERENAFRKAISESMVTRPTGTGLTQTGPESQAGLLARPEFGGGFADQETVGALMSNPNLPTTRTLDQNRFMSALAEYSPLEFAKMQIQANKPGEDPLAKFKAFTNLTDDQRRAYAEFVKLTTPQGDKIVIPPGDTELQKLDAKDISALSGRVESARKFANTAASINTLLQGKGGGEIVKVGANVAQFLGLPSETASANSLAQALQNQSATQVRAAGSGSTSDLEFKSFLQVFPSLGTSETGRKLMADGLQAFAERDAKIERKARELFKSGNYSAAAIAEYDASLGPVLDPKKFGNISAQPSSSKPARRSY